MKKILLAMAILVFGMLSLFAQEVETTGDTAPTAATTAATDSTTPTEDNFSRLDYIVPRFPAINSVNDGMLQLNLDRLTNYVAVLRDDYLFRVVHKIDKIVEGYTNDYFIDTNSIDYADLDVYNIVAGQMASDANIALGIGEANKALAYLETVRPSLIAIGKTNDVDQIDYHLNLYAGILNMYSGGTTSKKRSLDHFNYALNTEMAQKDTEMYLRLNTYIASLNYELINFEVNNDVLRKFYYNNMFDALWNIVDKTTDDENIKDAKFIILINQFYTIIYTDTVQFKTVYSKYFDKLGFNYGKTEETILDKPVMDEYKDDDGTEAATAPEDDTTAGADDTGATAE